MHADEYQSFYKLGLLFLMEVVRYLQSTQNRKLIIFLKIVLQLLLCSIVMQNIQIFYGVQPCLLLLVSSYSQTRHFLPEHLNIIIKQQLCGEGLSSLLSLLQADIFQRSRVSCSKSFMPIKQAKKKVCISPCDTNNFTQSLTRKYHHTATESLYRLCVEKISCARNSRSPDHQFFLFLSHEVSHHKVRKLPDPNFCK